MLLGFLEGDDARRLGAGAGGRAPRGGRRRPSPALFGERAASPTAYIEKDWSAEPFSRGCYAGVFGPGAWTSYGRALREPVGRVHWAGTETATRWMGYFDGAIQAGRRAAAEVIAAEDAQAAEAAASRSAAASSTN